MSPAGWILGAALFLVAGAAALADIDDSEYETKAKPGSRKERARLKAQIEEEARLEAERALKEAEEEARRGAAERARLEARPWPVRLTERRCTLCHTANNYAQNNHTWLGWQAVALRMEYLNHCPLEPGERKVIVAHLAETHPAPASKALVEWGTGVLALALPLAAAMGGRVWWRRRRGTPG